VCVGGALSRSPRASGGGRTSKADDDSERGLYSLYAVVCHLGQSKKSDLQGGHYVVYVRCAPSRSPRTVKTTRT
jgi:uncharacterized UBP type Zn finger protein